MCRFLIIFLSLFMIDSLKGQTIDWLELEYRDSLYYKIGSDKPFSGICIKYFEKIYGNYTGPERVIREKYKELNFQNGKLNGPFTIWNTNFTKQIEGNFKNNLLNELIIEYDIQGYKTKEYNYKDGVKDGQFKLYNPYKGSTIPNIRIEGEFKDGLRNGVWREWDWNGNMINEAVYVEDKLINGDLFVIP